MYILHVGTINKKYEYEMSRMKLESVQFVKDLGIPIATNLESSKYSKEAVCELKRMLSFINGKF